MPISLSEADTLSRLCPGGVKVPTCSLKGYLLNMGLLSFTSLIVTSTDTLCERATYRPWSVATASKRYVLVVSRSKYLQNKYELITYDSCVLFICLFFCIPYVAG